MSYLLPAISCHFLFLSPIFLFSLLTLPFSWLPSLTPVPLPMTKPMPTPSYHLTISPPPPLMPSTISRQLPLSFHHPVTFIVFIISVVSSLCQTLIPVISRHFPSFPGIFHFRPLSICCSSACPFLLLFLSFPFMHI